MKEMEKKMLVSKSSPMTSPAVKFKAKFPTIDVIRVVTGQIENGAEKKAAEIISAHCFPPSIKTPDSEVMNLFNNKFPFIQESFAKQHPILATVIEKAKSFFAKPTSIESTKEWISKEAAKIGDTFEITHKGISKDDYTKLIRN